MFMLKIILLAVSFVAYAESRDLEEYILVHMLGGKKRNLTKLDIEIDKLFGINRNIDNSIDTRRKCFSCLPGYDLLKNQVIEPAFDLTKKVIGCADVILDVPEFKHERCHMSWAAVMLSIIRDRICMWAGAPVKLKLTPRDIMDCCPHCEYKGQDLCENGGDPLAAWKFWIRFGVDLEGTTLFKKASPPTCLTKETEKVGKCNQLKCIIIVQGKADKLTPKDIVGHSAYLLPNNMSIIQAEIMLHGPVQCVIQVFRDLLSHKSGVYRHKSGKLDGYHNVKLIGWGVDEATKTPYWKVVFPSWGLEYGERSVIWFFRGENECDIESNCIGSVYKKSGKTEGKPKEDDKKKDGDKKKTKSSANFNTANYSFYFIHLIIHILVVNISY